MQDTAGSLGIGNQNPADHVDRNKNTVQSVKLVFAE